MMWLGVFAVLAVPVIWALLHLLERIERVVDRPLPPERALVVRRGVYDWKAGPDL